MESEQYRRGFEDGSNGYPPMAPGHEYFNGYFEGRKKFDEEDDNE